MVTRKVYSGPLDPVQRIIIKHYNRMIEVQATTRRLLGVVGERTNIHVDDAIDGSFKSVVLAKDPTESIIPLLENTALLAILLDDFELGQHALIVVFAHLAVDPGIKAHPDPIVTTRPVVTCGD
jgi:hypothetical protein